MNLNFLKLPAILVYLGIFFFPLQNFAVSVASSQYDITSFLYLFLVLLTTFKNYKVEKKSFFIFFIFILIELIIFLFYYYAPFYRLISGLVWLGGLILFMLSGDKINYNFKTAFKIIVIMLILSSVTIIMQAFLFNIDRPKALFDEPSYAGLCLYSGSAGLFSILYTDNLNMKKTLFFVFIFCILFFGAILTFSMHLITFILTILFLTLSKISIKNLPFLIFLFLLIIFGIFFISTIPHYYTRLNLANPEANVSLLSWLEGFDQMKHSITNAPIFGFGLGSTGYFPFNSEFTDELAIQRVYSVNLTDAYSAAFRLVVEIGFLPFLLFLFYLYHKFKLFKNYQISIKKNDQGNFHPEIFLFIFAFSLIIGFLIKEPSYARSYVYLSFLLLTTVSFKKIKITYLNML